MYGPFQLRQFLPTVVLIFDHSNDVPYFFRDPSIRSNVGRILKIWAERKVYDPEFMEEINSLLGKSDIVVHPKRQVTPDEMVC